MTASLGCSPSSRSSCWSSVSRSVLIRVAGWPLPRSVPDWEHVRRRDRPRRHPRDGRRQRARSRRLAHLAPTGVGTRLGDRRQRAAPDRRSPATPGTARRRLGRQRHRATRRARCSPSVSSSLPPPPRRLRCRRLPRPRRSVDTCAAARRVSVANASRWLAMLQVAHDGRSSATTRSGRSPRPRSATANDPARSSRLNPWLGSRPPPQSRSSPDAPQGRDRSARTCTCRRSTKPQPLQPTSSRRIGRHGHVPRTLAHRHRAGRHPVGSRPRSGWHVVDDDVTPSETLTHVNEVIAANPDVIEDPNLIYPGEVFAFPAVGTLPAEPPSPVQPSVDSPPSGDELPPEPAPTEPAPRRLRSTPVVAVPTTDAATPTTSPPPTTAVAVDSSDGRHHAGRRSIRRRPAAPVLPWLAGVSGATSSRLGHPAALPAAARRPRRDEELVRTAPPPRTIRRC